MKGKLDMADDYDPRETPWQIDESDFPADGSMQDKLRFITRYAILAPSSHNSQPWRFRIKNDSIDVFIDMSRWLKVADSDQREIHISVGCALENLLIAAEHFGLGHELNYFPDDNNNELAATIKFDSNGSRSEFRDKSLFDQITKRHTNHGSFEDRRIPFDVRRRLMDLCVEDEIDMYLTDNADIHHRVEELIARADAIQFSDPEYRDELAQWIGKGVFGSSWLMSKIGQMAVKFVNLGKSQAKKDSGLIESASFLAAICSDSEDHISHLKVGQVFERVSLAALSMDIAVHPMSQILELPELRKKVAGLIPESGKIPQHTFRMGYAEPEDDHTPRRELSEVLE